MTLNSMLSATARQYSRRSCIRFSGRKYSYGDVEQLVRRVSGGISSFGLKRQDRVAILMSNRPEYIISYFAILRAGCIAVPVNTFLIPEEISYILRDSSTRLLIYDVGFTSHVKKIGEKVENLRAMEFNEIPQMDGDIQAVQEEDVAVILYTSGTTGFPKGAMLTHRNLLVNAKACKEAMFISERDRILLFLPLFHSFSFTICVILPLLAGAVIVLLPSANPFSRVVRSVLRERVTFFVAVPTVYRILLGRKMHLMLKFMMRSLTNLRACISGASALPAKTLTSFEKSFGIPLIEGYGLTEASPVVSVNPLKGVRKPSSVGYPLPGIEAAVIGEGGMRLAAGQIGELIVKGPNVMKGYYKRESETKEVIKDGWLYTGDMAKIDEDGYIYIVDRKKDMIVVNGMNVYPREIEEIVCCHPLIEDAAMIGAIDRQGFETPLLYVMKKRNVLLTAEDVMTYLQGRAAQFKMPKRVVFVDEFPRTSTGKIKKKELRMWKP